MPDVEPPSGPGAASVGVIAAGPSAPGAIASAENPLGSKRLLGRTRWLKNVLTSALFGMAVAGLVWYFGQSGDEVTSQSVSLTAAASGPAPRIGRPAPDFHAVALDGSTIDLSQLRGRAVWLTFWATWCPPCRAEATDIQAAHEQFAGRGLVILAVDVGEDPETVRRYVQGAGLTYMVAGDPSTEIAAMYRVGGLPTHFFIDVDGIVRDIRLGSLGRPTIEREIAAILPPRP
jgi:peroxiredoxin